MKFLAYANGEKAAANIREMLEAKGIPVTVESEHLPVPFGPYAVRFRLRIFVCLDSQFADAVELVKNPSHVVAGPVNAEEYHRWAAAQPMPGYLVWGAAVMLLGALAFFLVALWLSGALGGA